MSKSSYVSLVTLLISRLAKSSDRASKVSAKGLPGIRVSDGLGSRSA